MHPLEIKGFFGEGVGRLSGMKGKDPCYSERGGRVPAVGEG